MRSLSICVLGGTGFLGTRVTVRLLKEGHQVTVLSRDREQHKHLRVLPGLKLENCDVYDAAALGERLRGQDVAINLIGILNEPGFGGAGFRRAHTQLARTLVQAAGSANIARLLQISSLKAASDAPSYYLKTKGEAEKIIQAQKSELDWTILQPSVIFGPGDSFLNRFANLLGALPIVFPLAKPNARFQPVHVDNVVDAIVHCLQGGATSRKTYQLGGPEVFTLHEIVSLVAKIIGHHRLIIGLPDVLARVQALIMNFVPGRPFSSDNYRSLCVDSVCDRDGFAELNIKPQSLEPAARQFLGALEYNAQLSQYRKRSRSQS